MKVYRSVLATLLVIIAGGGWIAADAPVSATSQTWTYTRQDAQGGTKAGVSDQGTGLTLNEAAYTTRAYPGQAAGMFTSAVLIMQPAINQITVDATTILPEGTDLKLDVRGRAGSGAWGEWIPVRPGEAQNIPLAGAVQYRVTLLSSIPGVVPTVSDLALHGTTIKQDPPPSAPAPASAPTYRIFATREGLVGHRTANGHIITPYDHFVSLPSGRALSSNGGYEYQVRVCYPVTGRCEVAPVWDVGPWNERDDYWNTGSARQQWHDLPAGVPQAQAAFLHGYNGGADQGGRIVGNPAGIDLADGTFYDLGLVGGDWVEVTFLWTAPSRPEWPTLQGGASGTKVRAVQNLLNHYGHSLTPTGHFGDETVTAVKAFQSNKGLPPTGIVGPETFPYLVPTVWNDDYSWAVSALQVLLGVYDDGHFGRETEAAVRDLQARNRLDAVSIVDLATWQAAFNQ